MTEAFLYRLSQVDLLSISFIASVALFLAKEHYMKKTMGTNSFSVLTAFLFVSLLLGFPLLQGGAPSVDGCSEDFTNYDEKTTSNADEMLEDGREIFRFDTFGDEEFWGGQLRLHQAVAGERFGGVGPGLSPNAALELGLKVDMNALSENLVTDLQEGRVDLDDPATTLALLKSNAVVGLTGFFDDDGNIESFGIQCALCHSTVDDAIAPGVGRRLDGWANRDLNVGAIIALAPNLQPFVDILEVDEETVRNVLNSWGPGKFDAILILDGKAFRPDGSSAATLIPPAFGLAGVNLITWTGWGSVPYWNALVANLEMHGQGTFFDPRLNDSEQFPVAAREGFDDVRSDTDRITSKLAALHFYQLAIPAPDPPEGSFDKEAAARGKTLFSGKADCARCHVPPLFVEPGWNMHTPEEIGIDDFQANRSPDRRYRTAPLKGLWTHMDGGFFHDGRFATLVDVIEHYNEVFSLQLTESEKGDLVEYLKSLGEDSGNSNSTAVLILGF
jgi:mono/diheme cytochrome c family protein